MQLSAKFKKILYPGCRFRKLKKCNKKMGSPCLFTRQQALKMGYFFWLHVKNHLYTELQCSSDISELCIRVLYARILRIRVCLYAYTRM